MTDFAVGDRVGWLDGKTMRDGRIVRTTSTSVYVDAGGDDPVLFIGDGCDDLTSIEEPQPWQGECFGCQTPLTPGTACRYEGFLTHVCYLCPVCWTYESDNDRQSLEREQVAALANTRAAMHERHPDTRRWQEAQE